MFNLDGVKRSLRTRTRQGDRRPPLVKGFMIAVWLFTLPVLAVPIPKPTGGGGDYWIYNENTWLDWVVVSPELVGRLTPKWPSEDAEPDALTKVDWVVYRWPVVAKFVKGQRLRAVPDDCGGILIKDIDGGTWMKVETGSGTFCFVRANAKYLKPIGPDPGLKPMLSPSPQPSPEPMGDAPPSD